MFQTSSTVSSINVVETIARHAGFSNLTPLQEGLLPQVAEGKDLFVNTRNQKGKALALLLSVLLRLEQEPQSRALVIAPESSDVGKLGALMANLISYNKLRYISVTFGPEKETRKELKELSRDPDIIIGSSSRIIDHIRWNNIRLKETSIAAVFITKTEVTSEFRQDLMYIFSKIQKRTKALFLSPKAEDLSLMEEISRKPQQLNVPHKVKEETPQMSKPNNKPAVNEEAVKEALDTILKNIRSVEDPNEMDAYKKLIKKNVPLTMRSYVGAYLLKQMMGRSGSKSFSSPRRPAFSGEGRNNESRDGFTTLFFSRGKNRRVYPKDLSRLLSTATTLSPEDIGTIRILDSYSFIEIRDKQAGGVIETLNGSEFRGRKLTVNYARKR